MIHKKKSILLNSTLIFMTVCLILSAPACGPRSETETGSDADTSSSAPGLDFSVEVKAVLDAKKALLQDFVQQESVILVVEKFNLENTDLTEADILKRDSEWQNSEGMSEFVKSFITNECARLIFAFQEAHDEFTEIFITDIKGTIIGESNRTSDYYQADEEWWQKTYNNGKGLTYYGEIEYDDSARTEAIALFMAIVKPETGQVIGILKAVLDINAIKLEL